jgi:hypothetical protein
MVSTYGITVYTSEGKFKLSPCAKISNALPNANNKLAPNAQKGFQFPNITAAKAINPRPDTIPSL